MKALKILGGAVGAVVLAVFVFWFGWLRAPAAEDVCNNMATILKKESGVTMEGAELSKCVQRLQPPEFGRAPWVKKMKCMNNASTMSDLKACERPSDS